MIKLAAAAALLLCAGCASKPPASHVHDHAKALATPGMTTVVFAPARAAHAGVFRLTATRPGLDPAQMRVEVPVAANMDTSALATFIVALAPESWTAATPPAVAASGSSLFLTGVTELSMAPGATQIKPTVSRPACCGN